MELLKNKTVRYFLRASYSPLFVLLVCIGCGGGTTGTSGTSELRLLGSASREDGSPIVEESMDVIDEATQLQLLASSTNKRGNFLMTLTRPALGVVVEIDGARTLPITSSLAGNVTISTLLSQNQEGNISVTDQFSASPRLLSTCASFEVSGNTIRTSRQIVPESCSLLLGVESSSLQAQVKVLLTAKCSGTLRTFAQDTVQGVRGLATVDLASIDYGSCTEPRVELVSNRGKIAPIVFEISRS